MIAKWLCSRFASLHFVRQDHVSNSFICKRLPRHHQQLMEQARYIVLAGLAVQLALRIRAGVTDRSFSSLHVEPLERNALLKLQASLIISSRYMQANNSQ